MRSSRFVLLAAAPLLACVLLAAVPSAGNAAPAVSDRTAIEDISGTYVDASARGDCDLRSTRGGDADAARAVTVVYWRGVLTLRVVPAQTLRALHVQARPRPTYGPSDYYNGLARWDAGELVVESGVPALPLWTRPTMPRAASTLLERFAFSESALIYRASYRGPEGEILPGKTFELTLVKCGVAATN